MVMAILPALGIAALKAAAGPLTGWLVTKALSGKSPNTAKVVAAAAEVVQSAGARAAEVAKQVSAELEPVAKQLSDMGDNDLSEVAADMAIRRVEAYGKLKSAFNDARKELGQ